MEHQGQLKEIFSECMRLPGTAVDADTLFIGGLANSLGRARLDSMLRSRLNISTPGVYTAKTFGELCHITGFDLPGDRIAQSESQRNSRQRPLLSARGTPLAVGVDIESVHAMPEATDYWEDEFYRQHFTQQEIAYSLLQLAPRQSFAAMWCAKEALRKADARWTEADWHLTEVAHGPTGKPALISQGETIPCSVSLSHTGDFAIAVVAMAENRVASASQPERASLPPSQAQPVLSPVLGKLSLMLSAAAIMVSLLTLGIVFFR